MDARLCLAHAHHQQLKTSVLVVYPEDKSIERIVVGISQLAF
jgi:hypothetical protein